MTGALASLELECSITGDTTQLDLTIETTDLLNNLRDFLPHLYQFVPSLPPNPEIQIKKMTIGTINYAFKVTIADKSFMIRIYGGEAANLLGDRKRELSVLFLAERYNYGPKVYLKFNNGFVVSYIDGKILSSHDLPDPFFMEKIATEFANWHNLKFSPSLEPILKLDIWENFEKWFQLAEHYSIDVEQIRKEIQETKSYFIGADAKAFAHHDLNSGNVIYSPEQDRVYFVDYEFAGLGNRYFDLANHFCEFAGLDFDFSLYPSKEKQISFLTTYLKVYAPEIDEGDRKNHVLQLHNIVEKYQLLSHLFWALWGKLMAEISDTKIFDYSLYSQKRLSVYFTTKRKILAKDEL